MCWWRRAREEPDEAPLLPVNTCRICWEAIEGEPRLYCGCVGMPYHRACILEQFKAWANRDNWDRRCDVCGHAWDFLPRAQPEVPPHTWTRWRDGGFDVPGTGVRLTGARGERTALAEGYRTVNVEGLRVPGYPDGQRVPWDAVYAAVQALPDHASA